VLRSLATAFRIHLGTYPTPVEELRPLSRGKAALWVKRDDLTSPVYGGNKVRKLEYLLEDARARGAKRVVTIGAAGSHHVLATTIFGAREGFEVEAVLVPQPRTDHAAEVLRAGLAHGLRAIPAEGYLGVVARTIPRLGRGAAFITVGGSSVLGSLGYVDAARELAAQVREGAMPEPDVVVVALGSGGTAAGLAAGFEAEGLRARVIGVVVAEPPWFVAWRARRLARACLRRCDRRAAVAAEKAWLERRLVVDGRWLGDGYGRATEAGARAAREAGSVGLRLDPTYTSKAFAAALERVEAASGGAAPSTILYWHTLSSAPLAPLLRAAPDEGEIGPRVSRLLT
jgi:D-cysteine desulfhydrase